MNILTVVFGRAILFYKANLSKHSSTLFHSTAILVMFLCKTNSDVNQPCGSKRRRKEKKRKRRILTSGCSLRQYFADIKGKEYRFFSILSNL